MYENLVNRLREYAEDGYLIQTNVGDALKEAADAIEELKAIAKSDIRNVPTVQQEEQMSDSVNHPSHYTQGGIECIEAIKASLGNADFASYCKGNVLKYIWRYRHKNGAEDLEKARVYLDWMIEAEKERKENNHEI